MLEMTIELALWQAGGRDHKGISGFCVVPERGLVFMYYGTGSKDVEYHPFPVPIGSKEAAAMASKWLTTPAAKEMKLEGWDANLSHDGDNGPGWRCYIEDWGHVLSMWGAVCAIRPAFMWYGK